MTPGGGRTVASAGGVVVRNLSSGPHVLLIKDRHDQWGLPKGHAEPGEAAHETALREVTEETGLSDLELGPELMTIDWQFSAEDVLVHKFATFFLMFSRHGDPVPERAEGIMEATWVPLESVHERVSYPNAITVVRAVQSLLLDAEGSKPHTEPMPGPRTSGPTMTGER
jgi:8-oxo-dGTP pyrophosphatase MutT (NUDIX family)